MSTSATYTARALTLGATVLVMVGPVEADVVGLATSDATTPLAADAGFKTCRVFVQFDEVGDNFLAAALSDISTNDPEGFVQVPAFMGGADTAPSQLFLEIFPELIYDSFVTVNLDIVATGSTDCTNTDPAWDSGSFNNDGQTAGGWVCIDPSSGQGMPDPQTLRVLVAQFTVNEGAEVSGTFTTYFNDGDNPVVGGFVCRPTACQDDTDCDDRNLCTNEQCDRGVCIVVNNGAACDDGSICTTQDTCQEGQCAGGPPPSCAEGLPVGCDTDCNNNGVADTCDLEDGAEDCNQNDLLDACEPGGNLDCDGNGTSDLCDVFSGADSDCNENLVPDGCDIDGNFSDDCNANGTPDECELAVANTPQMPASVAIHELGGGTPYLTSDGNGTWLMVYRTNGYEVGLGSDYEIFFARSFDDGVTWTDPEVLNATAEQDRHSDFVPRSAGDGNGTWITAWRSNIGASPVGDILVSRSGDDGASWSFPLDVSGGAPGTATDTLHVATGAGAWVLAWGSQDSSGGLGLDSDILFVRSTNGGLSWSTPRSLNHYATDATLEGDAWPYVATDGHTWIAVWHSVFNPGLYGPDPDIFFARSTNGGLTWSDAQVLNSTATDDFPIDGDNNSARDEQPKIATDGHGNWVAAWHSNAPAAGLGEDWDILYAVSNDDGLTWSPTQTLNDYAFSDDEDDEDRSVQLDTDGRGLWVATWQTEYPFSDAGSDRDIAFAVSADNGATWGPSDLINSEATQDEDVDEWPDITTNRNGNWAVVWGSGIFPPSGSLDIMISRFVLNPDCNGNGVSDDCDIADGVVPDVNGNGIPDLCECFADLNADGTINAADLAVTIGAWGISPGHPADFNGDGEVNTGDLAILLGAWGPC